MAHRDGATGAADTVDPQGPARDGAGEDAVTPSGTQPPADDPATDAATAVPADAASSPATDLPSTPPPTAASDTPAAAVAASGTPDGEAAPAVHGRKPRLPRPASGRTPAFGLSLGAIRQRSASATEGTAALRRNLADKEAQTNELREALDALRQALDDTTPPQGPEAPVTASPRRRGPLLALLALLAVAAVVVVAVLTRGSGGGTATPAPSASVPATASTTPSSPPAASTSSAPATSPATSPAASTPAVPGVTTTPMAWRGESLLTPPAAATSGPGVDAPGTDVTVAVDKDLAHVDVFERAVLASPRSTVTLALPPASVWGSLTQAVPVVTDLQVVLDGTPVRAQRSGDGWFALPPSGGTATKVELRYRVAGTIVNYSGASSARRLVGVPTFTGQGSLDASAAVHVTVDDPRVQNVYCVPVPGGPGGEPVCADPPGNGLSATVLAGNGPVVVLQADLVPLG